MKRLTTHILMLLAIVAMSSCTKNNGDIGYWFGLWHLDSIELNGEVDNNYNGCYYFKFQNKVFCLSWVDETTHDYIEQFAQWEASAGDKSLTVNFIDDHFSPNFGDTFPSNYMATVNDFNVLTLNNTTMILTRVDEETAVTVTYHLTRCG
ncbi:MAG: lipocalin-like domain-containing protein [Muribaculaceae bacterium]|nr:lipocalin-like domain-containing protein [Muribaculaceae bacterium]MDY6293595.1 lipocalin-like domain-containing protein [Bacteroidales bacterium]